MRDATVIFEAERAQLTALCYRMLGERAGAEDAVQDTWLRWMHVEQGEIANPSAWLRRAATNIAVDALRSAHKRREIYVGPWLPEPLLETATLGVEARFELAEACELALLWAMERLGPAERAAFILREAFDAGYDEIAGTLGKSEAACRQMVSRAHKRLQESGPRFDTPDAEVTALMSRFFGAVAAEDFAGAMALFAADAQAVTDGGRKARAARRVLVGPRDIVQVLQAVWQKIDGEADWTVEPGLANRRPALVRKIGGQVDTVLTLAADAHGKIAWLYVMRNPDKLP